MSKGLFEQMCEEESSKNFLDDLHAHEESKLKEIDFAAEINKLIEAVKDGFADELEAYVMLTGMAKAIEAAKAEILPDAIREFEQHGEKTVNAFGAKISKSEGGKYSYKHSTDWQNAKKTLDDLQKKMQLAYKNGAQYADMDTGEVIEMAKYNPNKTSLRIELK